MRILALGGPGAMGAVAVRVAAGLPGVHPPEVVIDPDRFFLDLSRHEPNRAALISRGSPDDGVIVEQTPEHG